MSGGNLSGVYHFYTMAVTAATMVKIYIYGQTRLHYPARLLARVKKRCRWLPGTSGKIKSCGAMALPGFGEFPVHYINLLM